MARDFPKLKKDIIGRVVEPRETLKNKAGDVFLEGVPMIITDYDLKTGEVRARPTKGTIVAHKVDFDFVGDKSDVSYVGNNQ